MTRRQKLILLTSIGISVIAIVLLSAGIAQLPLARPSLRSIAPEETTAPGEFPLDTGPRVKATSVFDIVIALAVLVLFLVTIITYIVYPEARRPIIQRLISIGFLIFAVYALSTISAEEQEIEGQAPVPGFLGDFETLPAEEITVDLPSWVPFAISLVLLAALITVGWLVWRRTQYQPTTLELITNEAQAALQELRSGADFKNTIIHCYYQMCALLSQERDIHRSQSMTAREFEEHLTRLGLPNEPVIQLTRLFEKARYDSGPPDRQDEHAAWHCLSVISSADGRTR
jgi:NADH:ubiquinone oxidoreductase subunit 6 (subunit J)